MRLYLDAAPVIYTVEQVPLYAAAVDARLSAPEVVRVASDLTRMECRVKPMRDGNADLLNDFDDYFGVSLWTLCDRSRAVSPGVPSSAGSRLRWWLLIHSAVGSSGLNLRAKADRRTLPDASHPHPLLVQIIDEQVFPQRF